MITRILWIVSLLCAVCAQQQATSQIHEYTFTAIVQDSGKFLGAKCDSKEQKCKKYMDNVCEFIKKPLLTSGPHPFGCEVLEHGDRSKDDTIDVTVKLQLLVKDPSTDLTFTFTDSTFTAVLKQSLIYLHNTPDANVTITGVVSPTPAPQPTPPEKPVVLEVAGKLHDKTGEVTVTPTETEQCEIVKQLFNQDLSSDLLNVMYKYSPKHLILPFDPMTNGAVKFQIIYPKEFFINTSIDYTKDFEKTINWGFKNSAAKNKYHLGENTVVTLKQPATARAGAADITYKEPDTIPFEFTASVKDDGKLYGKTCGGPKEECTEYKQRLCQLAQKPIRCGRVPTSWQACSVDVLSERQADKSLQAKIRLMLLEEAGYRITYAPLDSCPTFAGMYKLAFASQSVNPELDVTEFTPKLKPVAITTEKVDIQIQGTLQHKGSPVVSSEWKKKAEEKVKKDLLALSLPDEMLNTFYHFPDRQLESFEIDTKSENVIATITISYPKTVFEANAIDPGCDLNGMLQWGVRSAKTTKGYSFSADDTVVQNSAASERPVSFTFEATVTDNGKFQGAECSGKSGDCVEYKEKLCAFVRKPFISSEMASENDCVIDILTERKNNAINVKISLQLNMHASEVPFDVHCPTFGGAMNQAFDKLYNTPDAKLVITKIETLQDSIETLPNKPVGLEVYGSLYRNEELVNGKDFADNERCEVVKQLLNLDMGEDLLNVMYKYNKDNIYITGLDLTEPGKIRFNLLFKKEFFSNPGIVPNCNLRETLEWGFQHVVAKDTFYLGKDTTVQDPKPTDEPGKISTFALTYTALVDDKLNGYECEGGDSKCAAYRNELCQIIQEPLLCFRIPNRPNLCDVTKIERNEKTGKMSVEFTLGVYKDYRGPEGCIPPTPDITGCKTFKALHKLAFNTFYEKPPVEINLDELASGKGESVEFTVAGTLKRKDGKAPGSEVDVFELNYQLANMEMPSKLLQAVYKYNKNRTFVPVKPTEGGTFDGTVQFKIGYPKGFLQANGIEANCDLKEMLEWGFKKSTMPDGYYFEEVTVRDPTVQPPAGP